jgi:hypothetical protein
MTWLLYELSTAEVEAKTAVQCANHTEPADTTGKKF